MDLKALVFSFFNLEIAREYLPDILTGMLVTIELGFLVALTGLLIGMWLSVLRALQVKLINFFIICFADIMRALPLTNRVIAITKSTALGSVVGLSEVLNNSQSAMSNSGNATPLILGAIGCLLIFIPVVLLGRWTETRFRWKQ